MSINQLNLAIGLLVGVAIGLLLRPTKPNRDDNVRVLRRAR